MPYISYLAGGGSLGQGKVLTLTGRLPSHPRTLRGGGRMGGGKVRYMSITSYVVADFLNADAAGQPLTSLMDEEIVTDAQGRYTICYSRAADRPVNATAANGITWVNWGLVGEANFNLRWLTVNGGWKDRSITPDDAAISYDRASWLSENYDNTLVGVNGGSRVMGEFLPRFDYFTREEFEAR